MGLAQRLENGRRLQLELLQTQLPLRRCNEVDHPLNTVIGHHQQLLVMACGGHPTRHREPFVALPPTMQINRLKGCNFLGFT